MLTALKSSSVEVKVGKNVFLEHVLDFSLVDKVGHVYGYQVNSAQDLKFLIYTQVGQQASNCSCI